MSVEISNVLLRPDRPISSDNNFSETVKDSSTLLFEFEGEFRKSKAEHENLHVSDIDIQQASKRSHLLSNYVFSLVYGVLHAGRNNGAKLEANTWVSRFLMLFAILYLAYTIFINVEYSNSNHVSTMYYILLCGLGPVCLCVSIIWIWYTNEFGARLYNSGHIQRVKACILANIYMPNKEKLFLFQLVTFIDLLTLFTAITIPVSYGLVTYMEFATAPFFIKLTIGIILAIF